MNVQIPIGVLISLVVFIFGIIAGLITLIYRTAIKRVDDVDTKAEDAQKTATVAKSKAESAAKSVESLTEHINQRFDTLEKLVLKALNGRGG